MAAAGRFLRTVVDANGNRGFGHYCPGCQCAHIFWVAPKERPVWAFDGNLESPTFAPSMRSYLPEDKEHGRPERTLCHYFLRAGVIDFLADSSYHALRGQVPLPPFPTDYILE